MSVLDLTGRRFGRLTVVSRAGKDPDSRNVTWNCRCDCGGTHVVRGCHLTAGGVKSCGCLRPGRKPGPLARPIPAPALAKRIPFQGAGT